MARRRQLAVAAQQRQDNDAAAAQAQQPVKPRDSGDIECFGTGMDVTCSASFDEGADIPLTSLEQAAASAADLAEQPAGALGAAALLSTLVLISPFFFWGTSMVGMKVGPAAAV